MKDENALKKMSIEALIYEIRGQNKNMSVNLKVPRTRNVQL